MEMFVRGTAAGQREQKAAGEGYGVLAEASTAGPGHTVSTLDLLLLFRRF